MKKKQISVRVDEETRADLESLARHFPGLSYPALARLAIMTALEHAPDVTAAPAFLVFRMPEDLSSQLLASGESASSVIRAAIQSLANERIKALSTEDDHG